MVSLQLLTVPLLHEHSAQVNNRCCCIQVQLYLKSHSSCIWPTGQSLLTFDLIHVSCQWLLVLGKFTVIPWDRGMTMEHSLGKRVYCRQLCFSGDRSSTRITSASNSLQVCNPSLSSASAQNTGQSSLYSDWVSNSFLPVGVEAAGQLHQVVSRQVRILAIGTSISPTSWLSGN